MNTKNSRQSDFALPYRGGRGGRGGYRGGHEATERPEKKFNKPERSPEEKDKRRALKRQLAAKDRQLLSTALNAKVPDNISIYHLSNDTYLGLDCKGPRISKFSIAIGGESKKPAYLVYMAVQSPATILKCEFVKGEGSIASMADQIHLDMASSISRVINQAAKLDDIPAHVRDNITALLNSFILPLLKHWVLAATFTMDNNVQANINALSKYIDDLHLSPSPSTPSQDEDD